jgi:quercetin dioxygenase-like cupin family protein
MSEELVVHESTVEPETWSDADRGEVSFRTVFGAERVTSELIAGVTDLQPGGWLGHHRHTPAEIYYVLEGRGTLTIDGEKHEVVAGAAAYIPGNSEHGIRNTGDAPLRFFYVFAMGGPVDGIDYRFTGGR